MKFFSGSPEDRKSAFLLFSLSSFLFLYVFVRTCKLSITWDEAYNYLEFTRKGILSLYFFNGIAANNHLLNSWLTYLITIFSGISEFTLRIPNLIAYILFLFYTAKISNEFSLTLLKISTFLVLNLNPYMLDFFSLSRGYGLSYGLLAGCLWYLYLFLKNNFQNNYSLRSLAFAMIAVFAHLTLIHFAISLFIVIVIADFLFSGKDVKPLKRFLFLLKKNFVAIIVFSVFLLIIIPRITGLKNADALFYGGTTGFWSDTVLTVFERSLYDQHYPEYLKSVLSYLAIAIMLIVFFISIKRIYSKNIYHGKLFLPILFFLLFSCSFATVIQHQFLNVLYLTNRTALYLLILFSFLLTVFLNEISKTKRIFFYILPLIAILSIVHFYYSFNLKYVLEWKLDSDVKEMIHDIDSLKKETPPQKFCTDVGMNMEFGQAFNYYRFIKNLTWLNVAEPSKQFHQLCDFYLYTKDDFKRINIDSFVVIKTYPLNNSMLLKRKYKPSHYAICFSAKHDFDSGLDSITSVGATSEKIFYSRKKSGITGEKNEYSGALTYKVDFTKTLVKNSLMVIKAMVYMEQLNNTEAGIVVSFENNKQIYFWQKTTVRDFESKAKTWFPVFISCSIPNEVQQGDKMSVYLWNKNTPVYIDDMEMRWITAVY